MIYDETGRPVFGKKGTGLTNDLVVQMGNAAPGVYFVHVVTKEQKQYRQLMVVR